VRVAARVAAASRADESMPEPSAAMRALAPRPMRGPFAADDPSGEALRQERCWRSVAETWPELEVDPNKDADRFHCTKTVLRVDLRGTSLLDAQVWHASASYNWNKETVTLAVRTRLGWYFTQLDAFWENRWHPGELKLLAKRPISIAKAATSR
jgi:hypothetical protein